MRIIAAPYHGSAWRIVITVCAAALLGSGVAMASPAIPSSGASPGAPSQKRLIVGTKPSAPFVLKGADGTWSGISIELWHKIATTLHLQYEFREYDLPSLVKAVGDSSVDVAIAALSITAEREQAIDFSHPYYNSGLSIAVLPPGSGKWAHILERFLSPKILINVVILAVAILAMGALMWAVERRRNQGQFGGGWKEGMISGFWWSAVTMTTVGYGDKTPMTLAGRLIALIWMFTAIIMVSVFTATITTTLTISELETAVQGPEDLPRVHVATVAGSTSERYLESHHIRYDRYTTVLDGLKAVAGGDVDALVYDAPILRYVATTEMRGAVYVLPTLFERQYYGVALPRNSVLREEVNRVLLKEIAGSQWNDILYQYLGE